TIHLPDGPYPLSRGPLVINDPTGAVTLRAIGGQATIVAQGNVRVVFLVYPSSEAAFVNLTITGGNSSDTGGGSFHYLGTVTLAPSTVSGNSAYYGGGIVNDSGTLTLTHSTVSGNSALYGGGGILILSGTLTLVDSSVFNNAPDDILQA